MAVGCGPKIAKIMLILFNIAFWLSGLILIIVASVYLANGTMKYVDVIINASTNRNILIGFLVIGIIIFVIGFCGCCGAIKESKMLLGIYILLLIFIIVAEVAFGIYAIVKRQPLENVIQSEFVKTFQNLYGNDTTIRVAVDGIQQVLTCCGATKRTDWLESSWYNTSSNKNQTIPYSCCSPNTSPCWLSNNGTAFTDGCIPKIKDYANKYFPVIIGVALGIACFEIFVVICAFCLCRNQATHSQQV